MRVEGNFSIGENISTGERILIQESRLNSANSPDHREEKCTIEGKSPQEQLAEKTSQKKIATAVEKINKTIRIFDRAIHFTKHEESGRLWVKVIDTETKKVIREIPPEEVLNIVARLDKLVGLLMDERR